MPRPNCRLGFGGGVAPGSRRHGRLPVAPAVTGRSSASAASPRRSCSSGASGSRPGGRIFAGFSRMGDDGRFAMGLAGYGSADTAAGRRLPDEQLLARAVPIFGTSIAMKSLPATGAQRRRGGAAWSIGC